MRKLAHDVAAPRADGNAYAVRGTLTLSNLSPQGWRAQIMLPLQAA